MTLSPPALSCLCLPSIDCVICRLALRLPGALVVPFLLAPWEKGPDLLFVTPLSLSLSFSYNMESNGRAAFSLGGTARGAYIPYPSSNPTIPGPVTDQHHPSDQHTSDVNDQHSSCDVHGDCAMGHAPPVDASADVSTGGPVDPSAGHASSRVSCACNMHGLHDHAMHASSTAQPEGGSVVAPSAATPHPQGACLPLVFEGSSETCSHESDMMHLMSASHFNDSSVSRNASSFSIS